MTPLRVGDRVKLIDAPESYKHMLGQAGRVISRDATRDPRDVTLRTDSGKLIVGERGQFLKLGEA